MQSFANDRLTLRFQFKVILPRWNHKLETSRPKPLSQLNALWNSITFIEKKVASLKRSVQYFETKLDNLVQYCWSNCLVVHGTGISTSNNYSVFVNNVIDKFNSALQMTEKLSPNDVDITHFLPTAAKKNSKESPPKKVDDYWICYQKHQKWCLLF